MRRIAIVLQVALAAWAVAGCGNHSNRVLEPDRSAEIRIGNAEGLGGDVGPRVCFHQALEYCYPDAGYIPSVSRQIPLEVEAGETFTIGWSGIPQGYDIRSYRWALDILDLHDETPRIDEATDLSRWSQRIATPGSATLGPFGEGEMHVLYVDVEDMWGYRSLGMVLITVVAATNDPPSCGTATVSPAVLWPPSQGLVPVSIDVADPEGDAVSVQVTGVTSDEPPGDGRPARTCPDAVIDANGRVSLRAERSAQGDGRVYTIAFTATDAGGASCQGSVRVCVPRDPAHACADGGQSFDATGPCNGSGRGVLAP